MNPYTRDKKTDFSLFFFAASNEHEQGENKYELLLQGSKFADDNGFGAVWIPERHFSEFGDRFPNPSVCAAAIAATTSRVRIRSGSVVLPLHDPIRVAEEWSVVDNLSHGRVELGCASGWHPNDFVLAPDNFLHRQRKMVEQIEEVRRLWKGEPLTRINGDGKPYGVCTFPRPIQPQLPIWVTAATAPETYRFAGSIGAKLLTNLLLQPKSELKRKIDIYYGSLIEHGFQVEDGGVAIMIHTFMSEDAEYTEAVVREPFKAYLGNFTDLLRPVAEQSGLDLNRARQLMIDMGYRRYFQTSGLFGSVEQCMDRVGELRSYGVSEIACLIDFGIDVQCTLQHLQNIARLKNLINQLEAMA